MDEEFRLEDCNEEGCIWASSLPKGPIVFRSHPPKSGMVHAGCGGEVVENLDPAYAYNIKDGDGKLVRFPAYFCRKCGREIIGDKEITLEAHD